MSDFDLRALLEALYGHGIDFVVIGGVAVGAHGFIRGTEDLDIVPDPDADNLKRLAEALGVPSYSQLAEDRLDLENLPEE